MKKNLAKALFFLCAFMLSVGVRAQTSTECVVVETTDGERMEYLLSDHPRISQTADKVNLTTATVNVELQAERIQKVYLSPTPSGIVAVPAGSDKGRITTVDGLMVLSGFRAGEPVMLFTTGGACLWQKKVDGSGQLTVSLSQLAAGVYIVKTSSQSIKITKK